jgi:hypothetical protein
MKKNLFLLLQSMFQHLRGHTPFQLYFDDLGEINEICLAALKRQSLLPSEPAPVRIERLVEALLRTAFPQPFLSAKPRIGRSNRPGAQLPIYDLAGTDIPCERRFCAPGLSTEARNTNGHSNLIGRSVDDFRSPSALINRSTAHEPISK